MEKPLQFGAGSTHYTFKRTYKCISAHIRCVWHDVGQPMPTELMLPIHIFGEIHFNNLLVHMFYGLVSFSHSPCHSSVVRMNFKIYISGIEHD